MKRKELYAYIREQIINELTPAELNDKKIETDNANKAIAKLTQRLGTEKDPDAKKEVQADLVVAKEKLANANAMKESELEEMASYKFFRVADKAKFNALKDIYAGAVEEKILDAIATAGEQGITQANLASELQMASALINPILKKFGSINAITLPVSEKPGKATAEEPEVEEPETEEPETPESDFFMSDKDSEEEKDMEPIDEPSEPSTADIAAAEKEVNPIDTEKIKAANKAANVVKNLAIKIGGMKKGPEREKKMAALKQYVKNNRGTILKGFKISDLTNGLIA